MNETPKDTSEEDIPDDLPQDLPTDDDYLAALGPCGK
jgi:hypothetical protein